MALGGGVWKALGGGWGKGRGGCCATLLMLGRCTYWYAVLGLCGRLEPILFCICEI